MVDVSGKPISQRSAVAEGTIVMNADTLLMVRQGGHKKGDVLAIARVAAIMAAKKTAEIVPLCHPLMLTKITVDFEVIETETSIRCRALAATLERTGVEMEALFAVQTALLTIYDMCKAVDRGMEITGVRLLHKSGGQSGEWNREDT